MTLDEIDAEIARRRGLTTRVLHFGGEPVLMLLDGEARRYSPARQWSDAGPLLEEMPGGITMYCGDDSRPRWEAHVNVKHGPDFPLRDERIVSGMCQSATEAVARTWLKWQQARDAWDDARRAGR